MTCRITLNHPFMAAMRLMSNYFDHTLSLDTPTYTVAQIAKQFEPSTVLSAFHAIQPSSYICRILLVYCSACCLCFRHHASVLVYSWQLNHCTPFSAARCKKKTMVEWLRAENWLITNALSRWRHCRQWCYCVHSDKRRVRIVVVEYWWLFVNKIKSVDFDCCPYSTPHYRASVWWNKLGPILHLHKRSSGHILTDLRHEETFCPKMCNVCNIMGHDCPM